MKKKLLITGGSGFLGINLALKLKKKYEIFLGSRNNKLNHEAKVVTGCEVLPLDVSSSNSLRDAMNYVQPEVVIHAAATKFVDLSEKYPLECIDINVNGSANVVRECLNFKVGKVIGISTDRLLLISLYIFFNEGGTFTENGTENESPIASPSLI